LNTNKVSMRRLASEVIYSRDGGLNLKVVQMVQLARWLEASGKK
jgi:hypothetical protein